MTNFFLYQNKTIEYLFFAGDEKLKSQRESESKSTTVVYLPGINDPVQNHVDFYKEVNKLGFDVYAINFPGFGGSEKFSKISWELLIDISKEFIVRHKLENITLFAYSMGSHVAIRLLEDLNNITEIKLIAPITHRISIRNLNFLRNSIVFSTRIILKGLVKFAGKKPPVITNFFYIFKNYMKIFSKEIYEYTSIRVPMKIIIFGCDEIINIKKVIAVFSRFPNVEIIKIEGVTHDIYYIHPEIVSQIVKTLFS